MAQNSSIFICSALQRPDRWKTRMEAEILSLWSAQAKAGSGIKDGLRLNAGFQECNTIFYKNMFKHPSFCIPTEVISVRHSHKPTWHRTVIYIFNWILDNKDIALCFKWLFRIWDKSFFFSIERSMANRNVPGLGSHTIQASFPPLSSNKRRS